MNPSHDLHKFQLNNKPKNDDSLVVKKVNQLWVLMTCKLSKLFEKISPNRVALRCPHVKTPYHILLFNI